MIIKDYNFKDFIENIPKEKKVFLLHGTLSSKIWYYRKLLELKLVGPKAIEKMRLVFLDKNQILKDKDILNTELKTRSFFGDQKVVIIEDVTDRDNVYINDVLETIDIDDHYLILTSGYLAQNSKIRKSIELNIKSCCIGIYPTAVSEREIKDQLKSFEIDVDDYNTIKKLRDLSSVYDFLEFKQEFKKLYLYKCFDKNPLSLEEIEKIFSLEISMDEKKLFDYLLEKNEEFIVDYFSNFPGEIKNPNKFILTASHQLMILYRMLITKDKSFSFLKKIWPPISGKNKEKFLKNSKFWKKASIEEAMIILRNTELKLRENSKLSAKRSISFAFLQICLLNK